MLLSAQQTLLTVDSKYPTLPSLRELDDTLHRETSEWEQPDQISSSNLPSSQNDDISVVQSGEAPCFVSNGYVNGYNTVTSNNNFNSFHSLQPQNQPHPQSQYPQQQLLHPQYWSPTPSFPPSSLHHPHTLSPPPPYPQCLHQSPHYHLQHQHSHLHSPYHDPPSRQTHPQPYPLFGQPAYAPPSSPYQNSPSPHQHQYHQSSPYGSLPPPSVYNMSASPDYSHETNPANIAATSLNMNSHNLQPSANITTLTTTTTHVLHLKEDESQAEVLHSPQRKSMNFKYHEFCNSSLSFRAMKPEKRTRRNRKPKPRDLSSIDRVCSICNAKSTPQWRSGPLGRGTLCNACGLKERKQSKKREQSVHMLKNSARA